MPRYTDVIDRMLKKPTMAALREYLGIGGSGDVSGPASSTDNAIVRFNGTTGGAIQGGTPVVQDDGRISSVTDPTGAQDVATKNYVDTQAPGAGDVVGPASSVDDRIVTFDGATGKLIQDSGVGIAVVPSSDQKAALDGTNGTPSGVNPYVTNSDPRNSDDRDPNAHAATHSNAAADPVDVTDLAGFPGGGTTFLRDDATWAAPGGGSGTVTSVALTAPSILSVAGSPVTTAGSLDLTLANQNANLVFAGPSTGAAAAPTFRSLTVADIPFTASAWDTVIIKSLDQVEPENAVLQPDDELVTPVLAASLYDVELIIKYTASSTASDYACALFYPSITQVRQCVAYQVGYIATNTASLTTSVPAATRFPSADLARGVETVGDVHIFYVKLFIFTTGAGNLEYRFSNNSALAGSTTTTFAGSILRIKKLS